MNDHIFTSIILSDGSKCDILEITPLMIWRASYKCANSDMELDMVPFLLEQSLIINNKKVDIDFIGKMSMDDYQEISDVFCIQMKKLPKF